MKSNPPSALHEFPSAMEVLANCAIGRLLPDDVKIQLMRRAQVVEFSAGDAMWTASNPARFLAVIHSGVVKMVRAAPQGMEVAVEILGPGDITGFLAAVCRTNYPLSAWAITRCQCLKIPIQTWNDTFDNCPELRDSLLAEVAPRLLEAYDFLATMLCGTVEQRLAHALWTLCSKMSQEGNWTAEVSQSTLASLAHTTVESCIRTTTKWQELGWIEKSHRSIHILDIAQLKGLVCAPPRSSF